jgi:hypothetical protein
MATTTTTTTLPAKPTKATLAKPELTAVELVNYKGDQRIQVVGARATWTTVTARKGWKLGDNVKLVCVEPTADDPNHSITKYVEPGTKVRLVEVDADGKIVVKAETPETPATDEAPEATEPTTTDEPAESTESTDEPTTEPAQG